MKRPTFCSSATLLGLAGAIAGAGIVGGCSKQHKDGASQFLDDATITSRVKSALTADKRVKPFQLDVETVKGVVQLCGFVKTSDQKAAAEKDAAAVLGVETVQNDIIIK